LSPSPFPFAPELELLLALKDLLLTCAGLVVYPVVSSVGERPSLFGVGQVKVTGSRMGVAVRASKGVC